MSKSNKRTKKNKVKRDNSNTKTIQPFVRERLIYMKDIVPQAIITKCKFLSNGSLTNVGFNTASKQLAANGAFDPDPSIGSSGVAGFAQWTNFYHRYRVWEVKSKCTFGNRETFPVIINLGFEPDFIAANAKTQTLFETENQVTQLMPSAGSQTKTLSMKRKAIQVVGDVNVMTDQGYTGTTGANPASLWYTSVAASCANLGAVFVTGISYRYEVEFLIEFYERKQLSI